MINQSSIWSSLFIECILTLEKHEAHDGEEVDKDDCQDEGEDDGPNIPGDWSDHITQGFLSRDEINQLGKNQSD